MTYQSYTIIARRADGTLFGDTVSSDRPHSDFREIYRHGGPYDIIAAIPGAEPYKELAQTHMGVETLEYRANDELDYHRISCHHIKDALRDAYFRGYDAGREPRETRQHDCLFCGKQWREYCDDDNYPDYCPGCGKERIDPAKRAMPPLSTDERKAILLEKYRNEVERSVRRLKNRASHLHTRRFADAAVSGDLRPFWANELCTNLLTLEDTAPIREAIYAKYGIAD